MKAAILSGLRIVRGPVIFVGIYLILHALFGSMTEDDGLLTPEGSVNIWVALLGVWVLLWRLTIVCALPSLLTFHLVRWLISRKLRT